jgi:aspartate racemase
MESYKDYKLKLKSVINYLKEKGAEGIILGCTELPLIINKKSFRNVKIFDSSEILAEITTNESYKKVR